MNQLLEKEEDKPLESQPIVETQEEKGETVEVRKNGEKFESQEAPVQLNFSEAKKIVEDVKDVKRELQDIKKDFLIMFGLFASIVTFLSLELQILKTVNDFWLLLGMSCFLLSTTLLFVFSLNNMVKDKNEWKDYWNNPVFILIIVFLFVTLLFFGIYFRMEIAGFYNWYRALVYR